MGFLLAVIFAVGVGCVWFGAVCDVQLSSRTVAPARLLRLLRRAGLDVSPYAFMAIIAVCGAALGLLAWWIVEVPAVVIAAVIGGGGVPVAWARSRRERRARERERAWPAAIGQLADALEAGLAWPAAVALVAESGPAALRAEWTAFTARLRGSGLDAALAGMALAGERTADSIVLLLRAALVELPAGGLAPVLRELSQVLSERLEARERARSRASTMHVEAAILALSPIVILLLIGAVSPGYLDAYRTAGGTIIALLGGGLIFGCYLLMRRLGRVPEPRRTTGGGS